MAFHRSLTAFTTVVVMVVLHRRALSGVNAAGDTCYDYDGTVMDSDVPCNPSASQSVCCGPYFVCMDSGICQSQNTSELTKQDPAWVRGSCTDKTWKSSHCPQYCIGDIPSGGGQYGRIMIACDKDDPEDGSFCCFGDPCTDGGKCFPKQGKLVSFGNQTAETTISVEASTTIGLLSQTTATLAPVVTDAASSSSTRRKASESSSARRTSTNSSFGAASSVSSGSSISGQAGPTAQTSTPRTTSESAASATHSSAAKSSSDKTPMKVGIGVGVIGGVALLAAISLIFWWRRRHAKSTGDGGGAKVNASASAEPPNPQGYGVPPSELEQPKTEKASELNDDGAQYELPMPSPRRPQELPTAHSPS